jgi:putative PEP-CTERM system histidine kinase
MYSVPDLSVFIPLLAFVGLFGFSLINLVRRITGKALMLASLMSLVWATSVAFPPSGSLSILAELSMLLAWQVLLVSALGLSFSKLLSTQDDSRFIRYLMIISVTVAGLVWLTGALPQHSPVSPQLVTPLGMVAINIIGLVLIEQLARNVVPENAWRLHYLNIGVSIVFAYGVVIWSAHVTAQAPVLPLTVIQPAVNALAIPCLIIASLRNRSNQLQFSLSRRFVFRTGVLTLTGVFLVSLSTFTYLGQLFAGDLGLSVSVFLAVVLLTLTLAYTGSSRFKSVASVVFTKSLFKSRYDHREEWTNLTARLTEADVDHTLEQQIQLSIAKTLHARSASVWILKEQSFRLVSPTDRRWPSTLPDPLNKELARYFSVNHDWVLDRKVMPQDAADLDAALTSELPGVRFIVPLPVEHSLYGVCLVGDSEAITEPLDWEDFDTLKLIGRQCGSYLALVEAKESLHEHEKFAAVAQISAFLVHDIKTISSQLSLLLENAEKHKKNPRFVDDMVTTVENSVERMQKIMQGLSEPTATQHALAQPQLLRLDESLKNWHHDLLNDNLRVKMAFETPEQTTIPEGFVTAINHLVQNALESSPEAQVQIQTKAYEDLIYISITDNGQGMSQDFVDNELFKPFHSSKGVTGMGIGAFQAKSMIEGSGGELTVTSSVGSGTTFTLLYPRSTALLRWNGS